MERKHKLWTPELIEALLDHSIEDDELARMMGVTLKTIRTKRWAVKNGKEGAHEKRVYNERFDLVDTDEL